MGFKTQKKSCASGALETYYTAASAALIGV